MFPEWTWIVGLFLGATIGSFINVVIYRMPLGMSLSEPKNSFCPNCKHQLGVPDLVPLLSWLFLRGKCRHCGIRVSSRYFWVEMLNGSLWAVIWYQHLIIGWDPVQAIGLMLFVSALVAAIFIDLRWFIIPDQINAFMLFVGLAMNLASLAQGRPDTMKWGIPSSIAGALAGFGVLWLITLFGRIAFRKDAMGHGDIKMARGIGSVLMPAAALLSFGLAIVLGSVLGVLQVVFRNRTTSKEPENDDSEEEAGYEPESVGSILKSGIGYLLCFDVIGLFIPKFYEKWFGENPYAVEAVEDEEAEFEATMIPFGPYLALGAIGMALFGGYFFRLVESYWRWATGG